MLHFEMELFSDIHTVVNVYACAMFHFIKCQSAFISVWMAVWDFWRGTGLCFKGSTALMNIPFAHEITSCNNMALLPKDILLQTPHTLPQAHTHAHMYTFHTCLHVWLAHIPIHRHKQVQVDYLYISIRMFTSNLPFSAQVLSNTILSAWLSQRISF